MSKTKTRIGRLAIAFAALLTVLAVSGPTRADNNWQWNNEYRYWSNHDNDSNWRHRNNGWGNGGWNSNWRHNNYPRYIYVRPRPYYYYYPRPYYYDYDRPSFNFVIPLHID